MSSHAESRANELNRFTWDKDLNAMGKFVDGHYVGFDYAKQIIVELESEISRLRGELEAVHKAGVDFINAHSAWMNWKSQSEIPSLESKMQTTVNVLRDALYATKLPYGLSP